MKKRKEDIVIIGAGVGGLTAAKTLAEDGFSPLVLEKNKGFGQKACGEVVFAERFGFSFHDFAKDSDIILERFNHLIMNYGDKTWTIETPCTLFSIDKKGFEKHLAEEAKNIGARIHLGRKVVKIERRGATILINGEIETKLIIGADGFFSKIREFVGEHIKGYSFAVSAEAECDYRLCGFFNPNIVQKGCAWIFPRGKKRKSNIGVVSFKETEKMWLYWKRFVKKFKLKPTNIKGAFIPAQLPSRTYFDNILLVGDAACLTDPFTGAGINSAIISGFLAAETAKEALKENRTDASFLKRYEKAWRKRMYFKLFKANLKQKIFYEALSHHENIPSMLLKFLF